MVGDAAVACGALTIVRACCVQGLVPEADFYSLLKTWTTSPSSEIAAEVAGASQFGYNAKVRPANEAGGCCIHNLAPLTARVLVCP